MPSAKAMYELLLKNPESALERYAVRCQALIVNFGVDEFFIQEDRGMFKINSPRIVKRPDGVYDFNAVGLPSGLFTGAPLPDDQMLSPNGGPSLLVTVALSSCSIVMEAGTRNGAGPRVAHLIPDKPIPGQQVANNAMGHQLQDRLQQTKDQNLLYFGGPPHGGSPAIQIFGRNNYADLMSASFFAVRNNGEWTGFAQILDQDMGVYTVKQLYSWRLTPRRSRNWPFT